jgi:hypothetical protein
MRTNNCILCKKRERIPSSLFCEECLKKDIFVKIKAFKKSGFYKKGFNRGSSHYGKLKNNVERLMEEEDE